VGISVLRRYADFPMILTSMGHFIKRHRRTWIAGVLLLACALCVLLAAWAVPLPARLGQPPSAVVYFEDGTPAHVFLSPDDKWRIGIKLDEVDPDYIRALLRYEDRRFYVHPGIDPLAILRAVSLNLRRGRVASGASTITMQLTRLLEPRPRTYRSKLKETLRSLQLELRLSKAEILEAYLQFIPFGKNVEGIEAGALSYFGHRSSALSAAEIATLLAVPQQPLARFPSPANRLRLEASRNAIAAHLMSAGALTAGTDDAETPSALVVRAVAPAEMRPFPRLAPHAARYFLEQEGNARRVRSSLDPNVQQLTERLLAAAQPEAFRNGIHNAAVVVLETSSGAIRGLVGNFDFWDSAHGGQIIAFDVPRSPGSVLKPFLYALGIEKGIALPDYLVHDIPVHFGGYAPRNFDGDFRGLVTLQEALSLSLNLPFVNLLREIGVEPFLGFLRSAGVETISDVPGHYGLSAAIGGIELTPLEVAGLFAMLARKGDWHPVTWRADAPRSEPTRMLAPGAAFLTRQALSLRDRPDFPARREHAHLPADIHWKTGTSFGYRDAWAAGSAGRYTVVVWMGNMDQSPSKGLIGADAAGPVLFDILEALHNRGEHIRPDQPPADLTGVEICSYSGHIPGAGCPTTRLTWAQLNNVPTAPCPYHVRLDVDVKTGHALTPLCRAGRDYRSEQFLALPAAVRRWMKDRRRNLPEPPSLAPFCTAGPRDSRAVIISPVANQVTFLIPGMPAERQRIPLEANTHGTAGKLTWFVGGRFLGTVASDERLWWVPEAGEHEFVVVDEAGENASQRITVRVGP
jgi:penicillin-binding protein 1C